jgi:polyphosphate kinase
MQNRELSWLKFNERVLHEANRAETPLLERLKFIAIFTSNLDEFFMVRVGTLTDYALLNEKYRDNKTGMSAQEQLEEIFRAVAPLYVLREQAFTSVMAGLRRHSIQMLGMGELDGEEMKHIKRYFAHNVVPLLSPQIIDSRHPFPHLANKQLHIAVTLERKKEFLFGLIAIPPELDRLVTLEGGRRFVLLEDLIFYFAETVFSIYRVQEKNIIAVTRNADINMEENSLDEATDYRQHMKNLLKKRQRLSPVRLELACPASGEFLSFFSKKLQLGAAQIFYSQAPLELSFCYSLDRLVDKGTLQRLIWHTHTPAETLAAGKKSAMLRV